MESLFDAWGNKNPEWDKKYEDLLIEPFTDYRRGTSQYSVSRGKIFGAGYEMYIICFFIGLYFDKTRKLPDDKSKRKYFGHTIKHWGSQEGRLGRTSYTKIQEYMFAALVAKTDIDFISLEKGEASVNDAANALKHKMEEYANYGFHYLEEMLEDDPNSLFKDSAFLKIFTSFISEDNEEKDDVENFEEDIESFEDGELENGEVEDEAIDEEAMRTEAEKPWNEDDIERLKLFFEHGMEQKSIAERLGKSLYSVQYQLSQLGLIRMPLNVTVKNTEIGGTVINKSGKVIYTDEAPLKIFNDKIYRFNLKSMCLTVKDVKRVDGEWVKGGKMLVAYSESDLYPKLSRSNFIDDIEDFVEGDKREANKIKVKGIWYNYYGDKLGPKG